MHFSRKLEDSQIRFYKCNQCNYKCSFVGSLKTHKKTFLQMQPMYLRMHFSGKLEDSQIRFYKCNQCNYKCSFVGSLRTHKKLVFFRKCNQCNYECTFEGSLRTHQECQKGYMWKDAFIFLYKLMNHKRDSHAVYAVMHTFMLVLWGNTTAHWIKAINVTSVTTILFTRELLRFIMLLLHVHLQMFFRKSFKAA